MYEVTDEKSEHNNSEQQCLQIDGNTIPIKEVSFSDDRGESEKDRLYKDFGVRDETRPQILDDYIELRD